jgi:hypothetical protein
MTAASRGEPTAPAIAAIHKLLKMLSLRSTASILADPGWAGRWLVANESQSP